MTAVAIVMTQQEEQSPASSIGNAEFEALLGAVLDVAYRTAFHLSRDAADAEDLVQEAAEVLRP